MFAKYETSAAGMTFLGGTRTPRNWTNGDEHVKLETRGTYLLPPARINGAGHIGEYRPGGQLGWGGHVGENGPVGQ